ncbi:hypothetical protein GALMADRAFT_35224, partial [Galerina marginata CBS 339.88]
MEIGSPMASLYLLGNPDHYTQHKFIKFYWRLYVRKVRDAWGDNDKEESPEKVVLDKNLGDYVGLSKVDDYIY